MSSNMLFTEVNTWCCVYERVQWLLGCTSAQQEVHEAEPVSNVNWHLFVSDCFSGKRASCNDAAIRESY